ncbi:MAG: hypothetical protein B6D46_14160 [Polyangiaceae bacterium UTPRO1]|nr:MAG: hypothetical protein B6D46_14160 [Polyangiaceae bacterium UTPRO1]
MRHTAFFSKSPVHAAVVLLCAMLIVQPVPLLKVIVRINVGVPEQALAFEIASRRSVSVQSTEHAVWLQVAEQLLAA